MKTVAIPLLFALLVWGCTTSNKQFTEKDKLESLLGTEDVRFTLKPNRASSKGKTAEIISPPLGFIQHTTAAIISGDDLSAIQFFQEAIDGPILTHKISLTALRQDAYDGVIQGHAPLISTDGYFLTAAHVVENDNSVAIYQAMDYVEPEGETVSVSYLIVPIRKVFVDEASDFAIIKADINNLFNFEIGNADNMKGKRIFGGGWFRHGPTSGELVEFREALSEDPLIYDFATTAPIVNGDSGSGVFDRDGKLLGVTTSRGSRHSYFSMMNIDDLNEIIEADRSAKMVQNQSSHTTPASAPR